MPRKRFTTEQIITKLREAEVELSKGKAVPLVCKQLGVSEQTYYRWRKEYGGLKVDDQGSVLTENDSAIQGLYACGEMLGGVFYGGYPGGSGLTSGTVFGRRAGWGAAA